MPTSKKRTVYLIIDTSDVDDLDVDLYETAKGARERVLALLDEYLDIFTDEAGNPIEPALKGWKGKADLDVWEPEGRVFVTLKAKKVNK